MCLPLWGFLHSWCLGGFKPVRWASNPHDFCSIRRTIIGCGMAESLCFGCSNSHFGWLNFAYFALFLGNAGRVWCGSFGMPQGSPRGPLPVPWVGPEGSYQARELASLLWSLAASKQWQWGWDMLCQSDPGDHRCSRLVGALEHFFIFPNSWDDDPIWRIFFKGFKPPIRRCWFDSITHCLLSCWWFPLFANVDWTNQCLSQWKKYFLNTVWNQY